MSAAELTGCLELESLGLFPLEALVAEVTILGGLAVDRVGEVEFLDNNTRSKVEVLEDDIDQLSTALVAGAVGLYEEGQWLGNTDRV